MANIIEVSDKLKSLIDEKGDIKAQYMVALTKTREITMRTESSHSLELCLTMQFP